MPIFGNGGGGGGNSLVNLPMSRYAEIEAAQSITAKGVSTTLQHNARRPIVVHHRLNHWLEQSTIT